MEPAIFTKTVKSGKTTYFVDVRLTKNEAKYISLTSSAPSKEDPKKFDKRSVFIFDNVADELMKALNEAHEKSK